MKRMNLLLSCLLFGAVALASTGQAATAASANDSVNQMTQSLYQQSEAMVILARQTYQAYAQEYAAKKQQVEGQLAALKREIDQAESQYRGRAGAAQFLSYARQQYETFKQAFQQEIQKEEQKIADARAKLASAEAELAAMKKNMQSK